MLLYRERGEIFNPVFWIKMCSWNDGWIPEDNERALLSTVSELKHNREGNLRIDKLWKNGLRKTLMSWRNIFYTILAKGKVQKPWPKHENSWHNCNDIQLKILVPTGQGKMLQKPWSAIILLSFPPVYCKQIPKPASSHEHENCTQRHWQTNIV